MLIMLIIFFIDFSYLYLQIAWPWLRVGMVASKLPLTNYFFRVTMDYKKTNNRRKGRKQINVEIKSDRTKKNAESRPSIHQCEFCPKTFSRRGNYMEHRRTHTGLFRQSIWSIMILNAFLVELFSQLSLPKGKQV